MHPLDIVIVTRRTNIYAYELIFRHLIKNGWDVNCFWYSDSLDLYIQHFNNSVGYNQTNLYICDFNNHQYGIKLIDDTINDKYFIFVIRLD